MAATYYTLLTKIGQAKIANAIALDQSVSWTTMAVGDGNGNPTTPNENQTQLVRENYRAPINQLTVDPDNLNYMVAEMIVPTNVGGWAVNEVGIFDEDGDLVAVSNFPATYKPQLEEGSGRDLVIRIIVQVSNADVVTLKVDPAIVLASQKWVADNYVKKVTVAGGTTGQVLAKASNANEDFEWIDPDAAVSVVVDALPERQTLADGQTVINLAVLTTQALAVYIEGARLIETVDYTVNSATQFTLARAYPAGSRIHMYQNDPTSAIADATETQRGFITLATEAEAMDGENDEKAITPATLGAVLATAGRLRNVRVFESNGTYTKPEWLSFAIVEGIGGGGGGGGTQAGLAAAAGGGSGGWFKFFATADSIPSDVSVTVGGAGAAGATGGGTGGNGGTSSFGSLGTGTGGIGGAGGSAGGGTNHASGGFAGGSSYGSGVQPLIPGDAQQGSQGTHGLRVGSGTISVPGIGGSSPYGGGGSSRNSATGDDAGNDGRGYGAGGGGGRSSSTAVTGGAGAPGVVIVWEYE